MKIKTINSKNKIDTLKIDTLIEYKIKYSLWETQIPETFVKIGFIKEEGFYFKFKVYEENPVAIYKNHSDPVFKDSAVEAFVEIIQGLGYFNIEINSNGKALCAFGKDRNERVRFSEFEYNLLRIKTKKEEKYWEVEFLLPNKLIEEKYKKLENIKSIRLNLYKICECENPHFGSMFFVDTKEPDFHRPEFFEEIKIEG